MVLMASTLWGVANTRRVHRFRTYHLTIEAKRMFSLQPIYLNKYISFSRSSWQCSQPTKTLFYLSWEDALWDLMKHKKVVPKSVILVPDFFCDDVEDNMRAHGLSVKYYPVNSDLQTTQSQFEEAIALNNPKIIIIFHAVGISNQLLNNREWMKNISEETILIEDCVHRVIEPTQVKFYKKNHFILTSLRKVVPLQESILFGSADDVPFKESNHPSSWWYASKVTFLWLMMNNLARLTQMFYSQSYLAKQLSLLSEKLMLIGYDLIGDNIEPAKGWPIFFWLYRHFNFEEIKRLKETQAEFYEKLFSEIKPIYQQSDRKELSGWPLIMTINSSNNFIEGVRREGLMLRFELDNSAWSQKQKIVYLPMGPHILPQHQIAVANVIKKHL